MQLETRQGHGLLPPHGTFLKAPVMSSVLLQPDSFLCVDILEI